MDHTRIKVEQPRLSYFIQPIPQQALQIAFKKTRAEVGMGGLKREVGYACLDRQNFSA